MKRFILSLGLAALLCGFSAKKTNSEVSFVFTPNRFSEIEPCGCQITPLGGIDREWNARKDFPKDAIVLSGGTTFVPMPDLYKKANLKHYRKKAEFMMKGFEGLGTQAISPSINDLILGEETLHQLQKKSKIKFVSANVISSKTKKPIFESFLKLNTEGTTTYVIGLSGPKHNLYSVPKKYTVEDPIEAYKKLVAGLPKGKSKFIVVLSSLTKAQREKLQVVDSEPKLILGGASDDSTHKLTQENANSLFANNETRGRSVTLVSLSLNSNGQVFYNADSARRTAGILQTWSEWLADANHALAKTPKGKENKTLLKQKANFETVISRLKTIPQKAGPQTTAYEFSVVGITDEFKEPKNHLSKVITGYKDAVRSLALQE